MSEGPQRPPDPDYKAMEPGEMLAALADDAHKWATAYCQFNSEANHCLMTSWFANAIETAWDHRMRRIVCRSPPGQERHAGDTAMRPTIVMFGMMCAAVLAVASVVQAINSWLDIQLAAPVLMALAVFVLLAVRDAKKEGG